MNDWRKTEYRPVEQPKPSAWDDFKFTWGVWSVLGLLVASAVGIVWGLAVLF